MSNVERIIRATIPTGSNGYQHGHIALDLMDLTTKGWEVVERFDVDEVIHTTEQVLPPMQNGYQPPPTSITHEQIGKQAYLRLRKDGESVLGELSEQLETLKDARDSDLRRLGELDKEAAKLKAEIERLSENLTRSHESNEALRKQKDQIEQIKRQLEGDIGKIREHIGRKTMDEVLGVKKTP